MGCLRCLGYLALVASVAIPALIFYAAHYTDLTGMLPILCSVRGFEVDDIPDLSGKVVFVTGANTGLGFASAKHVALAGAKTVLGCRSKGKCDAAVDRIKELDANADVTAHILDLGNLAAVQESANRFLEGATSLDALILNAGIMAPPYRLTDDGFESQFGVNHVAHFYFAQKLLPLVRNTAKEHGSATITSVSSYAHTMAPDSGVPFDLETLNQEDTYDPSAYYGISKLANILYGNELSKRLGDGSENVFVNTIHPGAVATELSRHISASMGLDDYYRELLVRIVNAPAWSSDEAALTQLYTAVSPEIADKKITGQYFHPLAKLHTPSHQAVTQENQVKLWDFTNQLLSERGFTDYESLSA